MANTSANDSLPCMSSTQASLKTPKTNPWSLNREIMAPGPGSVGDARVYARLTLPLITSLIRWPGSARSFSQALIWDAAAEACTPCPNRARWERRGRTLLAFRSGKWCEATSRCMLSFRLLQGWIWKARKSDQRGRRNDGEWAWRHSGFSRDLWVCQRDKNKGSLSAHFKARRHLNKFSQVHCLGPEYEEARCQRESHSELMHNERFPVKMVDTKQHGPAKGKFVILSYDLKAIE